MYHFELRKFPHTACRFNLTERELLSIVLDAWVRDQWVDVAEREWNSHESRLTVVEGPGLEVDQLAMGRGWRNAQRMGQDVTERVMAAARRLAEETDARSAAGSAAAPAEVRPADRADNRGPASEPTAALATAPGPSPGQPDRQMVLDSLGLELLSALGADSRPPALMWQLAAARQPDLAPAASLALAEAALGSLLDARLVLLTGVESTDGPSEALDRAESAALLRDPDTWTAGTNSTRAWVRRA